MTGFTGTGRCSGSSLRRDRLSVRSGSWSFLSPSARRPPTRPVPDRGDRTGWPVPPGRPANPAVVGLLGPSYGVSTSVGARWQSVTPGFLLGLMSTCW